MGGQLLVKKLLQDINGGLLPFQPPSHPFHHLLVCLPLPDSIAAQQDELQPFPLALDEVRSGCDYLLVGLETAIPLELEIS